MSFDIARRWDASIPGVTFRKEETFETAGMTTSVRRHEQTRGVMRFRRFNFGKSAEIHRSHKMELARDSEFA
jgi:hypothetical protein